MANISFWPEAVKSGGKKKSFPFYRATVRAELPPNDIDANRLLTILSGGLSRYKCLCALFCHPVLTLDGTNLCPPTNNRINVVVVVWSERMAMRAR